jgi:hypothetical protein
MKKNAKPDNSITPAEPIQKTKPVKKGFILETDVFPPKPKQLTKEERLEMRIAELERKMKQIEEATKGE